MNRRERRAQSSRENRATNPVGGSAGLIKLAETRQAHGHHHETIALLKQVLAREPGDAAAHAKITIAYQAVDRHSLAVRHFKQAIWSGLKDAETLVRESPAMMVAMMRFANAYPRPPSLAELLGTNNAVADDPRLVGLLQSEIVRDVQLELFLTAVRRALLVAVTDNEAPALPSNVVDFACALAEQCFLNEYVYSLSDPERDLVVRLKQRVIQDAAADAPADIAVLGCYLPLHTLPDAARLLDRRWPKALRQLITRQVHEPLAEAADIAAIPALTAIEDRISQEVQDQYEENPYPRWTINPLNAFAADPAKGRIIPGSERQAALDILVAGCGTGLHAVQIAQLYPASRLLAVDISRTSLAYARRKTRELGLRNVEYAQADILELGGIDRTFDRIESVGVLHHLADPTAGWRVLVSRLRPGGTMRIGLYSNLARRLVVEARERIAARGYRATAEDIRKCRQDLIREAEHWKMLIRGRDFYNMSGCRDLLFNVMEHRFTIPDIAAFLNDNDLSFLEFEPFEDPRVIENFHQQFADAADRASLDQWHRFESSHPDTFLGMYLFTVGKFAT